MKKTAKRFTDHRIDLEELSKKAGLLVLAIQGQWAEGTNDPGSIGLQELAYDVKNGLERLLAKEGD